MNAKKEKGKRVVREMRKVTFLGMRMAIGEDGKQNENDDDGTMNHRKSFLRNWDIIGDRWLMLMVASSCWRSNNII